jgi:hypothetical protein
MRRSNKHWPGDLAATLIVLAVAGFVFWFVPASDPPNAFASWVSMGKEVSDEAA